LPAPIIIIGSENITLSLGQIGDASSYSDDILLVRQVDSKLVGIDEFLSIELGDKTIIMI
jgi:hypothetical protein